MAAQPDEGHTKYMYLGQVLQGEEAVRYYSKGLEVMNAKMEEVRASVKQPWLAVRRVFEIG